MKRLLLSSAVAGLVLAAAAPAAAAPFITIVTGSGTFGNNDLTCATGAALPCTFSDTINFTTPVGYNLVALTLTSVQAGTDATTNVDFTTASLNGANFTIGATGVVEFRYLTNQALSTGATNTLLISGLTGGNGSYAGTLEFAAAAVPEPATWGMMVLGFGAVGFAMRRRQAVAAKVSYAA
jgi:hypothetical protein